MAARGGLRSTMAPITELLLPAGPTYIVRCALIQGRLSTIAAMRLVGSTGRQNGTSVGAQPGYLLDRPDIHTTGPSIWQL